MVPLAVLLLAAADPGVAAASFNPRANELFDRDPVLNAWAVRSFDRNHDGWLTLFEAQPGISSKPAAVRRSRTSPILTMTDG